MNGHPAGAGAGNPSGRTAPGLTLVGTDYNDTAAVPRPNVRRMADVTPERVEWLWPGRLPIGKLVVLDGDPGCGKSTLTLDLAAHFSTATCLPDGHQPVEPCNVVLLSAEDGPRDTIRPRLDAARADPTRVILFEEIVEADPECPERLRGRMPRLPDDISHLAQVVHSEAAKLVVVDVLAAFLAGRVDAHRDQDIRGALAPLARMAESTRCCVIAIRHLNKSGGPKALYRGGGSIGIIGAARVGLIAGTDPDDEDRRILAVTKSNLSAPASSLAYRVVDAPEYGCGRIHWEGTTNHHADDLVADRWDDDDTRDATQVLAQIIADGPRPVTEIIKEMNNAGFSVDQAKRAKKRLGMRSRKVGAPGEPQHWEWLPADSGGVSAL